MLKVEQINNIYVASFENISRFNALITEPVKEQLNNCIDSSGFGVFLSIMKTANINYGHFKICNINREVMDLFKLLQLHNVFEIYSNLDDCIKSYNN